MECGIWDDQNNEWFVSSESKTIFKWGKTAIVVKSTSVRLEIVSRHTQLYVVGKPTDTAIT